MKKYLILMLIGASILNSSEIFAQSKRSPCNSMVTVSHHAKHHPKSIARRHVVKKRVTPYEHETINLDDRSATAIVSIKNGDVYVNDSLVAKVKNPKNEDHRIIINYITPPPEPVTVIEHVKTNTYTGELPVKGMLGVRVSDNCKAGATIEDIIPCSPAEKYRLLPGDVITKIDDHSIANSDELLEVLGTYKAGDKVAVTIRDFDGTETRQVELSKVQAGCEMPCGCRKGRW